MATTQTKRGKTAKGTTTRRKGTTAERRAPAASRSRTAVDRTTKLSDELLESVEAGQRAAIDAVHKFVDTVDRTLPHGESPSRRQEVVDSALEMADRLVHTQYDFIRKVVDSAGKTLRGSSGGK